MVNGVPQKPIEGVSMAYTFDDAKAHRATQRRSTSRCSATARSTTTGGSPAAATAGCRGRPPARRSASTTTRGSSTTSRRTSRKPTISPQKSRRSCASCRTASWLRLPSTTCLPLDDRFAERADPTLKPSHIRGRKTSSSILRALSDIGERRRRTPRTSTTRSPPRSRYPKAAPRACSSAAAASPAATRSS